MEQLTTNEIENAIKKTYAECTHEFFAREIKDIFSKKPVKKGTLVQCTPFIDNFRLLRMG